MNRPIDLTGHVYGRLTVVGPVERRSGGRYWGVKCSCGSPYKYVNANNLRSGSITSCGCQLHQPKHGLHKHELYKVWQGMLGRCNDPGNSSYARYGGRGIKVCSRWLHSFENFLNDVGERPGKGMTLDRKKNNKNYTPGNVRWATRMEQGRNRSDNVFTRYQGKKVTMAEASVLSGIPRDTLAYRIKQKWKDIYAPVQKKKGTL